MNIYCTILIVHWSNTRAEFPYGLKNDTTRHMQFFANKDAG
uniref:Uncharacterized protein n=1 Tax=Arundo donax TaxID=35708 RepID=A0A0A8ZP66_ARUDO